MSAYIVEDDVINSIVAGIRLSNDNPGYHLTIPNMEYTGIDNPLFKVKNDKQAQELGFALFKMNCAAVNARYGDNDDSAGEYKWKYAYATTGVRLYKMIRCLLYQCSEGDVPKTPLFKALEKFNDRLAHEIVGKSKEYEALPW